MQLLARQLRNPVVYLLLASAGAAFLLERPLDGAVVMVAVLVNALVGFFQEAKAGAALASLSEVTPWALDD